MKRLVIFSFLLSNAILLTFGSLSNADEFECAGGAEACAKERVLYRLERLTGESCSGGYQACKTYLEERLDDQRFAQELAATRPYASKKIETTLSDDIKCMKLKGNLRCLHFTNNGNGPAEWINPFRPPSNVSCFVNRAGTNAACVEK